MPDQTSDRLPFELREQAWDRLEEYQGEHAPGAVEDPTGEEDDAVEAGPGEVTDEYRRLRHAAEIAEQTYRRAEADSDAVESDEADPRAGADTSETAEE